MVTTDPAPPEFGSRIEIRSWLESLGYKTSDNVTKKTSILLVGPEHGRKKMERALKYGIPIIPYTFPLALGFFSMRVGSPFSTRELHTLTLYTLALADNLHAHYILTRDERFRDGCRLIVGVVQRLLLVSRGAPGGHTPDGDEGPSWADPESLREIIQEIDRAWELAIAFLELIDE